MEAAAGEGKVVHFTVYADFSAYGALNLREDGVQDKGGVAQIQPQQLCSGVYFPGRWFIPAVYRQVANGFQPVAGREVEGAGSLSPVAVQVQGSHLVSVHHCGVADYGGQQARSRGDRRQDERLSVGFSGQRRLCSGEVVQNGQTKVVQVHPQRVRLGRGEAAGDHDLLRIVPCNKAVHLEAAFLEDYVPGVYAPAAAVVVKI